MTLVAVVNHQKLYSSARGICDSAQPLWGQAKEDATSGSELTEYNVQIMCWGQIRLSVF